jgi:hypothetical protein
MIPREDLIAAARKLWGQENQRFSRKDVLRFGTKGSKELDLARSIWHDHEQQTGGGAVDLLKLAGMWRGNGIEPSPATPRERIHSYYDERGTLLFQAIKKPDGRWMQRRPDGPDEWIWNVKGVRRVPYRLPELIAADPSETVFIVEGEKDADNLADLGVIATTNPGGAGKWLADYNAFLRGRSVVIIPDNDEPGHSHAANVQREVAAVAANVIIVELPGLDSKGDTSDWLANGGTRADLDRLVREAAGLSVEDFYAHLPSHSYIFCPTRELWPAASVNVQLGKVNGVKASVHLDRNRHIEQMTWHPGRDMVIRNRLVSDGSIIERNGVSLFNLYRPPTIDHGDAEAATPWVNHVRRVYPDDAKHIMDWFAIRVQQPDNKVNHALVLGGAPGIGKDTMLEPVKQAVGPWNFAEVSPTQVMGRFNGFLKSIIIRVSEARDLGDIDRYQFYDRMKDYICGPPDVLRVDEKNLREYYVPNLTDVIFTTNHKANGMFMPPNDRRHYVAWSDATKEEFEDGYWNDLWGFYRAGGIRHVAAFLRDRDLSHFDPKAPPPRTPAFYDMVDSHQPTEDAELADVIDELTKPPGAVRPRIFTLAMLLARATGGLLTFLSDRRNRKVINRRLEHLGYVAVRNPDPADGYWVIDKKRQVIYADKTLSLRERVDEARALTSR